MNIQQRAAKNGNPLRGSFTIKSDFQTIHCVNAFRLFYEIEAAKKQLGNISLGNDWRDQILTAFTKSNKVELTIGSTKLTITKNQE